jgi:uncharacterized protein with beta-barrel porin domain
VGLALAGGGTGVSLGEGLGSDNSTMLQTGVYGRLTDGSAYLSAALGYSLHDVATNRTGALAGVGKQIGSFVANVISTRVEGGYGLRVGDGLTLTPYAADEIQAMWLPAFAEAALGPGTNFSLDYASHSLTTDRTELGAWMDYVAPGYRGALKLYARAAWTHDFNNLGTTVALFQSIPGSSFVINGARPAPDGAIATIGGQYSLSGGWSIGAKFDGEFSSTTNMYSASTGIRKMF